MSIDYGAVLADVEEHVEEREAATETVAEARRKPPGKTRAILTQVACFIVLVALGVVWLPIVGGAADEEPVYAIGAKADDPRLASCLRRLWDVRTAFDRYRYDHDGALPPDLGALGGGDLATCPATRKAWVYQHEEDGSYRIACPDPAALGRGAVFLDHRFGPPQVRAR
jgi:hypothetical protein